MPVATTNTNDTATADSIWVKLSKIQIGSQKPSSSNDLFSQKIKHRDLAFILRNLATLIENGLSLPKSLSTLAKEQTLKKYAPMLQHIQKRVEAGELFSKTLESFPKVFGDLMVNQIRVGERGGAMAESLSRLATQVENANKLRSQIIKKLAYPMILMGAGLVCVTFMLVFVIPVFEETYATSGIPLPMITKVLIATGNYTVEYGWILPLIVFMIYYAVKQYRKDQSHAQNMDLKLIKLPLIGSWLRDIAVLQFMQAVGDLLESGFHVVESLRLSAQSIGNRAIRQAVENLHSAVTRGEKLSHEMESQHELFPPVVSQLVIIGEKTGNMVHSTKYIRGHLQREIERKTNIMVGTIEPILTISLAMVIGSILLGIYLPMFDLIGSMEQ